MKTPLRLSASRGASCLRQRPPDSASPAFPPFFRPFQPITARAAELSAPAAAGVTLPLGPPRGTLTHVRVPIRDFDPYDLRLKLPAAVAQLYKGEREGRGVGYVHCTAGLGRAPATAVAYMVWCKGFGLQEAYAALYAVRPCHPKLAAIRQVRPIDCCQWGFWGARGREGRGGICGGADV